jgi:hypothetical protein
MSAPKPVGMSESSGIGMERPRLNESLRRGRLLPEPWESLGDRNSGEMDRSGASAHPDDAPRDAAKGISAARLARVEDSESDGSPRADPPEPPEDGPSPSAPRDPGPLSLMARVAS